MLHVKTRCCEASGVPSFFKLRIKSVMLDTLFKSWSNIGSTFSISWLLGGVSQHLDVSTWNKGIGRIVGTDTGMQFGKNISIYLSIYLSIFI